MKRRPAVSPAAAINGGTASRPSPISSLRVPATSFVSIGGPRSALHTSFIQGTLVQPKDAVQRGLIERHKWRGGQNPIAAKRPKDGGRISKRSPARELRQARMTVPGVDNSLRSGRTIGRTKNLIRSRKILNDARYGKRLIVDLSATLDEEIH
jgi:hypothetical protein